jgi:hypothetical protein
MNRQPTRSPLPGEVKSRINRIAHAVALQHEASTKQRLLDALQRLASTGAGIKAMHCHLDAMEALNANNSQQREGPAKS